jgi:predicted amidohydrolase YtcJ
MDRSRRVVLAAARSQRPLCRRRRPCAAARRTRHRPQGAHGHPGLIDAHDHIVLVGNRPGWHVPAEDVFTLPEVVARYQAKAAGVPAGEFVTTVGPITAMQFREQRLPTLAELDAVPRPVYVHAAQGGVRTNSLGKAWLERQGVTVAGRRLPRAERDRRDAGAQAAARAGADARVAEAQPRSSA